MDSLITVDWLNTHVNDPDLIILDTSLASTISGIISGIENTRIFGARFFDLKNDFSDKQGIYPITLPSPKDFQFACQRLGINRSSKIVVYDNLGIYWSPRVWWMFKTMGHDAIAVLDGGLPEWIVNGYQTKEINRSEKYPLGNFNAKFRSEMLANFDEVLENTKQSYAVVIDTRSADRFNGIIPEPRKGLRSGRIPNSINIPYDIVIEQGKFKKKSDLINIFKGLEKEQRPLIFSCGSGITACIVLFASELIVANKKAVYDGSWTEWGQIVK
tara:strand:- start:1407 stop:2222 length:816 start_codon:yes stop_codon:yes gene_type:complete